MKRLIQRIIHFLGRRKPDADRIPMDVMLRLLESKPHFLTLLREAAAKNAK